MTGSTPERADRPKQEKKVEINFVCDQYDGDGWGRERVIKSVSVYGFEYISGFFVRPYGTGRAV